MRSPVTLSRVQCNCGLELRVRGRLWEKGLVGPPLEEVLEKRNLLLEPLNVILETFDTGLQTLNVLARGIARRSEQRNSRKDTRHSGQSGNGSNAREQRGRIQIGVQPLHRRIRHQ